MRITYTLFATTVVGSVMSKDTFPYTSTSLRSLRLEQELQDWEEARRALAQRRALTRVALSRAPSRPPPGSLRLQEVLAAPPQIRCRDAAIHNTFMCGDMKGVYAILKDPAMVDALMETVHEEMVWAPEMGMWTMSCKVKQTSALRLASRHGHAACVEELLFRGAEVNADPGGSTALHDACAGGHAACVKLLLAHGADAQLLSADGNAPLHLCTLPLSLQCAELLLDSGADVNVRTAESRLTPLHVAASRGLEAHVELLLSVGADVLATNLEGETALNAACARAEKPSEASRYQGVVRRLLDAGADPRTAGKKQHTPLHNACANCCPAIVELLLLYGAQADVRNCAGYTPLECLLQVLEDYLNQQPESVVRTLLNHGAKTVPPKMLRRCVISPATLEVILNSYPIVPPCDWIDDCPLTQGHLDFFKLVRERSGHPRSLQHLCRCALRRQLGSFCHSQVSRLDVPSSVKDYLLLHNDGTLH
ncbi:ankyrin repeat and SOCS box protein 16 isoform X3 [Hippocampus zosterae]|uniref:ankyrin repeat and SOCS box protein 16 isoform X3 n=1 Tax=Hippocampus zosterae TaxID=109293 RepID=UPI00223CB61B|nr:ankyrin repeat and SOCS box protein 16 isoform X3 [Hippocampus zosterae]